MDRIGFMDILDILGAGILICAVIVVFGAFL